jgi:hypothetical protein
LVTRIVGRPSARWPREGRCRFSAARCHGEVVRTRENVENISVDEAAVVVTNVDDNAGFGLVLYIQINIELAQSLGRHIRNVHVAEFAAADALHVSAVGLNPGVIEQTLFRGE